MADAAQDPSQDQEFLKAPPTEQHAYLMDSDPDYAKGSPEDQQAYLAHIHATAARNEPPASRALSAQTGATARAAGESQRATKPILPTPEPTGAVSRFASGALSGAKAMIPSLPKTWSDFGKQALNAAYPGVTTLPAMAQEYEQSRSEGQPRTTSAVSAFAAPLGIDTAGIRERARQGDIAGIAGEAAPGVAATLLGPKAMEAARPAVEATRRGATAIARRVGEPFTIGSTGEEMMTKGISPRAQATGFKGSLAKAGPDIKGFHNDNPIKSVQDLDDAIPEIKQKIWTEEVDPALARQAQRPVDMAPVAQNVRAQITPEMREFDEANANKLDTLAEKLERARDVESANRLLKYVNGQLDSYFAKYPSARRSNLMNNPETAGWEGARQALRQQFLQTLEDAGESGIRDARLRYGALEDIGKEVERRVNVADRAKPMSLPRILGMLGAIPTGGLSVALGEAAHYLNKPDVLVRRGIAKLPEPGPRTVTSPTPYVPPQVNIRGLLPEAPILTPPPADTSGPVDLGEPTVLPLAENRQLPAVGRTTGPRTTTGPSQFGISARETTPGMVEPNRQLPEKAGTGANYPPAPNLIRSNRLETNAGEQPIEHGANLMPPSALPPEPKAAPKPPAPETPKAPPTNGAIKAARETAKPTGFKSNKSVANEKPVAQYRGAEGTSESDKLADKMVAKGKDRMWADERSQELIKIAANKEGKYTPNEVEQAQRARAMWEGPERRAGVRTTQADRGNMPAAPAPIE